MRILYPAGSVHLAAGVYPELPGDCHHPGPQHANIIGSGPEVPLLFSKFLSLFTLKKTNIFLMHTFFDSRNVFSLFFDWKYLVGVGDP